jgi:2-polyprenyl-3-methyl-5-hydroxy-6-metoxy-1,4-benzoquinol methylase
LASYKALNSYEWAESVSITADIADVFTQQVAEPNQEIQLKHRLAVLDEVTDSTSSKVREQYEESPYPRWMHLGLPLRSSTISEVVKESELRIFDNRINDIELPTILIAGCGTGQHSIGTSSTFLNSKVLAVDLSLTSLAYAKRKTEELGVQNIEYMQADILDLNKLNKQFDIVESSGVLHHMNDPLVGWKVLTNCVKPGGLMNIGLYSELARQHIVTLRKEISQSGIGSSASAMKSFRNAIIDSDKEHHKKILKTPDFYSVSELRDLLFHVQEHRFTLPQIQNCLDDLGLKFCGFTIENIVKDFSLTNTGLDDPFNLKKWHQYEQSNPNAFMGMYQFWCQKIV